MRNTNGVKKLTKINGFRSFPKSGFSFIKQLKNNIMILFQSLAVLFLFSLLIAFVSELVRKSDIKKQYNKCGCKSILSLKEFTEKYYNRI